MGISRSLSTLFLLVCLIPSASQAQDFIKTIADRLQAKAEFLIFNVPPRPDAWPGAIFTNDLRLPIVRGRKDDPALARGEPIEIDVTDLVAFGAGTQAGFWNWFSVAAKAGDAAAVTMSFPDLRVVDILLDEATNRAQQSLAAQSAAKRGRFPFVVVKSYEGTLTLTMVKKTNASAEAIADLKKIATQAKLEASALTDDRLVYKTTAPIVFAFEVMQAKFSPNDGGKIELAATPATTFYTYMLAQQEAEINVYKQKMEIASDTLRGGPSPFTSRVIEQQIDPAHCRAEEARIEERNGVFSVVCDPSLGGRTTPSTSTSTSTSTTTR